MCKNHFNVGVVFALDDMLSKFVRGRTAVFIDASNIFYSEQTLGWRIDFERLGNYLRQETSLAGLYYYSGVIRENQRQQSFFKKLKSFGYKIISKEVKFIRLSSEAFTSKGNLDVELALDAYIRRDQFDTFVLFSGDSDFAYLLDVLRLENKSVVVVSTRGHVSRELVERAKYIALSKLKTNIGRSLKFKEPDKPAPEV